MGCLCRLAPDDSKLNKKIKLQLDKIGVQKELEMFGAALPH